MFTNTTNIWKTMSSLIAIVAISFTNYSWGAGYQPNSFAISGGGVTCQNVALTLTATIGGVKCSNGGGTFESTGTITWYSSTDNSNATPGDDIAVFSEPFSTNAANTTIWTYNPDVATVGTLYYYYVITWSDNGTGGSCGPGSQTSSTQTVDVQTPSVYCHNFCTSGYSNGPSEYITNVSFSDINNTTGDDSGYGDYTGGACATVSPGEVITLCVTFSSGTYTEYVEAFFDWDNDGVYEDSWPLGSGVNTTLCTDVTVPVTATGGTTIGMRIIMNWNSAVTGPCMTGTYGETEDYCVTVNSCATTVPDAGPDQLLASCVTNTSLAGNTIAVGTGTWTLINGTAVITDPANPTTTVTGLGQGANEFVWTVVDAPCPTLTDTVTITTQDSPTPSSAGADQDGCVGATFTMDGNTPGGGETGTWSCTGGSCGSVTITTPSDPNTTVTLAGGAGTTATLTWTIDNGTCTDADNMVLTVISGVTAANAGGDQTECINTAITLAGNTPAAGSGTWSTGVGVVFGDETSPTSSATGITSGSYTLTWTISAAGCASSSDDMIFTVDPCDPTTVTLTCGSPETYTDGAGNYPANSFHKMTYCSTDPSNPYVTVTFSEFALFGTTTDYLTIIDGDGEGDPFIYSSTTDGAPGTITSSNADGCLTLVFMSDGANSAAGYTASVDCAAAAGSNTPVCNDSDCQGGCGRTICGDGTYEWAGDGISAPELNTVNNDCLLADEQCNVWYYINPASVPAGGGDLSLNILSNGGQDQDFAVWQGYNSTLDCPVVSGDAPIACNWVAMNTLGTGTGFDSNYSDSWHEPSLWITEADIANGIYYMVLINTYNSGGACPQTTVDLTFGGTALLSCEPLGVTIANVNAIAQDGYNYVYWETMNEYNCESFTVERSKDGMTWTDVGILEGNGTTDRSIYYSMKDYNRHEPVTYYRLKQRDYDGKIEYSKVVSVSTIKDEESWVTDVFPNPATESFTFQYNGHNSMEPLVVEVFDMLGRKMISKEYTVKPNKANLVYTSGLDNGQYQVVFTQGDDKEIQTISILK